MSLTAALNSARNSLTVRSAETDVVSRNIAGVNEPGYSRKTADLTVSTTGSVQLLQVSRSADEALFTRFIRTNSDAGTQDSLLSGVNQLQQIVDPALGNATPAGRLGALVDALQQAASAPDSPVLAQNAVDAGKSLVQTLNDASTTVQNVRKTADASIATSVEKVNTLLAKFQAVNAKIVADTGVGRDVTDQLDVRDQILMELSSELGIRTTLRPNNDMQIYTDGGATLFDSVPRTVTFQPVSVFGPGVQGNAVIVDGTPVTGPGAVMQSKSGNIVGLTTLRDQVAPSFQGQLDEIARGVINAFAESDINGANPRAGLFRDGVSTALPGAGLQAGLASTIKIAATVDQAQGGNPFLLRDGGISDPLDPNYKLNTTSAAAFSDRYQTLISAFDTMQSFDSSGGALSNASLAGYASSSVGWIESLRQVTTNNADQKNTLLDRAKQTLSSATGVSLDAEMSKMLDLERAYQGSAKLISVVDQMMQSLFAAVR
ncbi:MAG: flagellar hook-associated protein FlgK [Beijerinckiaceae bacterium]|jgi:flagellar hook-associated protein 1|nr:flagellar hook-associated protein FlgK [Beijerinckiaceae bacterium]MDO9440541.1 flagellar hook-associated protein FlgK [Beijerinckiaceae bacterium]